MPNSARNIAYGTKFAETQNKPKGALSKDLFSWKLYISKILSTQFKQPLKKQTPEESITLRSTKGFHKLR